MSREEWLEFLNLDIKEKHILEELMNIIKNEPMFPGDSISKDLLKKCLDFGYAVRSRDGNIHSTKMGRDHYHLYVLNAIKNNQN